MAEGEDFANDLLLTKQGRMQFGIELRIIDGDGTPLPWDGEQAGALQVRGPWVADRYFPAFERAGSDGWLDTGAIGPIAPFGPPRLPAPPPTPNNPAAQAPRPHP